MFPWTARRSLLGRCPTASLRLRMTFAREAINLSRLRLTNMEPDKDIPPDIRALMELEREIAPEHSIPRYLIEFGTPSLVGLAGAIWIKEPSAIAQLCALIM